MNYVTNQSAKLKVQSVANPLVKEGNKRMFKLLESGTANLNKVIDTMMSYNPGLERETIEAVLKLEQRAVLDLTLSGMRVNNGLFSAVASPKGEGGSVWDSNVNRLDICLTQGSVWRDRIRNAGVTVVGAKADSILIGSVRNIDNEEVFNAGKFLIVTGKQIKIAGDDDEVGVFFRKADGTSVKVARDSIGVNNPSRLVLVIPEELTPGDYVLQIVTRFASGDKLRKSTAEASVAITIE